VTPDKGHALRVGEIRSVMNMVRKENNRWLAKKLREERTDHWLMTHPKRNQKGGGVRKISGERWQIRGGELHTTKNKEG